MRRLIAPSLAALSLLATLVFAQGQEDRAASDSNGNNQAAEAQYYAAQAAMFSAVAHAQALERITEETDQPDFSLARTLISTASRSIQGVDSGSVAIGKARHDAEKTEAMKTLRQELLAATEASDEAHSAADGHGPVNPHARNMTSHLLQAATALVKLGEDLDIRPLPAPAADVIQSARRGKLRPGNAPAGGRERAN